MSSKPYKSRRSRPLVLFAGLALLWPTAVPGGAQATNKNDLVDPGGTGRMTYGSQSSTLLKVVGKKDTTVIYISDEWRPKALWDSRYLWMPLKIDQGVLELLQPEPWAIDIPSGRVTVPGQPPSQQLLK